MLTFDRRALVRSAGIGSLALGAAASGFWSSIAEAADGNLYVIAELVAKPDQVEALRNLLVPFVAGARKEPGCKHYSLLEDKTQPGRFLTFETWDGEAALDAHMKTPAIKAAVPKLGPILAKPFTQIKLSMVSDG